ncbi:hypothetical protein A2Z22_04175 [Candidatus Woesebacteria bacterium RBG_16_34_12]|uniref:N(4)-bis(aminopropyl)spermidine synthase C-terminal domain-containing protein n=1 Tax=Candidatus Woesebacteria bacterium RBG_16_34_12 TaxID=1802480 RepID=A0A1F7X7I0_9BACT|nr:MAG: hypothetical protein A2Z22_04175 [Candidatus Woesebacteria bacterium RBG_16_34_12]
MEAELLYKNILKLSFQTGVPVKKILDFLFVLKNGEKIENEELIKKLGLSKNILNYIKKNLYYLLTPTSETTQISKDKLVLVQKLFKENISNEENLLADLEGSDYKNILEILEKNKKYRLKPLRKYDQFTADLPTVAKRVSLMNFFSDIKGKRILFLGDDDFTSMACAMFGSAGNIQILDIDGRILNSIKNVSRQNKLEIQLEKYDAKFDLAKKYKKRFDIVFTDPPYTENGVNLFLSRSIQALNPNNLSARIYLCFGGSDRAKERFLPIYKIIYESGLMLRWVFDKFNRYRGASEIGNTSSLFLLDITPKTKALIESDYNEPIYTI